ncbi:lipase [Bacillus stercoris]|uniref:lipase n=1 Tax=Bacillus stercoris TaxID=2054641 RepID=UPI0027036329|nr:lipase [Bacillus stercoris]MDO7347101.1 lipase [Bacillus stercoris]
MTKNIKVPEVSDETYYILSRYAYNYNKLKESLKNNQPIIADRNIPWYVEKIKTDEDTGLDAVVLSQGEKTKNGKWVKSKNPENVVVSFAGTDLGKDPINDGAEAEYSAVNNDIYGVAFNSPSVVKLHTDNKQEEINDGLYDPYVRSIINPDDMVGAGYWNEYDRHNGTTIYTKNPVLSQINRKQRLSGRWGDQIEKNLVYFIDTVILRNPDTHGLNEANFTFDENGNITNVNGDELVYDKNLNAMLPAGAIGGGDAIKVTPKSAKKLAEKVDAMVEDLRTMKKEAQNAYQEHDEKVAELKTEFYGQVGHGFYDQLNAQDVKNTLEDIAQSYDKGPLFYDTQAEQSFIDSLQAAITDLEEIGGFLNKIADDFEEKDQMLANWLRL